MSFSSFPLLESNEDLWFDGGDIRVCARRFDYGALRLYKLYRNILAVHSPTLLSLLDKSLARHHIYIGGRPYAYLPDHDALDLELFFIAIYYPIYCFFYKENARTFSRSLPVFRIALKYKANDVIEALASQLEQEWPQSLSEWDASQYEEAPCVQYFDHFGPENWSSNQAAAVMEPVSAIQVARIANMPSVLSIAYYQLSRVSNSNVFWQDLVSQLGTTEDCNQEKEGLAHNRGGGEIDGPTLLSKEDLGYLALGKAKLSKYMLSFKKGLSQELVLHLRCADAWNTGVPIISDDPLADLLELCSAEALPGGNVCSGCRSLINERGREERARVWELLPQFFCLPVRLDTF